MSDGCMKQIPGKILKLTDSPAGESNLTELSDGNENLSFTHWIFFFFCFCFVLHIS